MLSCAGECLDSSDKCPKRGKIVFLTLLTGNMMIIKYYTHYSLKQSTWEGTEDARGLVVAGCGTQELLRTIYH